MGLRAGSKPQQGLGSHPDQKGREPGFCVPRILFYLWCLRTPFSNPFVTCNSVSNMNHKELNWDHWAVSTCRPGHSLEVSALNNVKTLSAMDVLAPTPMKNAVKCDTSCELQNQ
jgi:hypothetical protein